MTGQLVQWFVILLGFDFTVAIKKGSTHQWANHVSRIPNREEPICIFYELPNACLFKVEMVPKWGEHLVHFLIMAKARCLGHTYEENAHFMLACLKFQMIDGQLYHLG